MSAITVCALVPSTAAAVAVTVWREVTIFGAVYVIRDRPVASGPVCVPNTAPAIAGLNVKVTDGLAGPSTRAVNVQVCPPDSEQLEDEELDEAPRLTVVWPGRRSAAAQSSSNGRTRE